MRLNDTIGLLVSVFVDWAGVLANPRYVRIGRLIAWDKFAPRIPDYPVTMRHLAELASEGQYTFQVTEDGSLIQLVYEFDRDEQRLHRAVLAYYGAQSVDYADGTIIEAIGEPDFGDSEALLLPQVPWLRIDYDPGAQRGVLHGDCHLHISGLPNSRLLVQGVPTPKQFVEFIMMLFYPDTYQAHRLNEDGLYVNGEHMRRVNDPVIGCADSEMFKLMTHVYVPRGVAARGS